MVQAACRSPQGPAALPNSPPGPIADPIAAVLAQTIAIDMHNHVYPVGTEPHRGRPPQAPAGPPQAPGPGASPGPGGAPPPGRPPSEDLPGPTLGLQDALARSGFSAVCASFVLDFAPSEQPGDARATLLRWFKAVDAQLDASQLRRALTAQDLRAAHDHARPTIVQTVEGSMFIEGQLDRVEEVYRLGLRHLQLLHERDDLVSPLGDVNTGPARLGGLTAMGADVIRECNRLGILVDLAHASHETVAAALKLATRPVVVSHTSLDSWTGGDPATFARMQPRLISKPHAKVVADAGGVIGVWTHLASSLPLFVESIKAMADAVGVDHVGIGSDTDLLSSRGTDYTWPGERGFFPAVVGEMLRQGFSPDDIAKIGGGNYVRVFGSATAGSDKG